MQDVTVEVFRTLTIALLLFAAGMVVGTGERLGATYKRSGARIARARFFVRLGEICLIAANIGTLVEHYGDGLTWRLFLLPFGTIVFIYGLARLEAEWRASNAHR
jgi:hypothetical protein